MSIGPPVPETQHFQNLTLKILAQSQMTRMLHNYGSRQFHGTSNGINPSSGFRDMRSAKSGPNLWQVSQVFPIWGNDHDSAQLQPWTTISSANWPLEFGSWPVYKWTWNTGARNPKRSSKFVRGYGVIHSMTRNLMSLFKKIISLYSPPHFMAILYPTSLANLVVHRWGGN